ncbi:MAG: hypothetical protein GXX85_17930 [Ignavibacteria bacterium]|nr:hypothetical protein [Ignavibacteria bacterium]
MDEILKNLGQAWEDFTSGAVGSGVVSSMGPPGAAWAAYESYRALDELAGDSHLTRAGELAQQRQEFESQLSNLSIDGLQPLGTLSMKPETAGLLMLAGSLLVILVISRR